MLIFSELFRYLSIFSELFQYLSDAMFLVVVDVSTSRYLWRLNFEDLSTKYFGDAYRVGIAYVKS